MQLPDHVLRLQRRRLAPARAAATNVDAGGPRAIGADHRDARIDTFIDGVADQQAGDVGEQVAGSGMWHSIAS